MNKATVKKLEKLHKVFKKHEEAVEENFTTKQVAIAKYRMGYDEGADNPTRLHELSEVSEHFKCSISYVTKIMRDVTDFLNEMERDYKKNRVIAKGTGVGRKLNVEHETEGKKKLDFNKKHGIPACGIVIDLGVDMLEKKELPNGHHMVVVSNNVEREVFGEAVLRLFRTSDLHTELNQKLNNDVLAYERKAAKNMGAFILFAVAGLVLWAAGIIFVEGDTQTIVINILAILSGLWAVSRFLNALALGGTAEGMKEASKRLAL